jgi:predicted methyltransferase
VKNDKLTIRLDDGAIRTFAGRDAWALRHLIAAGATGLTTIDHPAPRWSHYVFRLRKAGLVISTEHGPHKGDYPGVHGRYRLETSMTIVVQEAA